MQILTRRRIDGAVAVVYKNTGSAIYRSVTAIAELVVAVDSELHGRVCVHAYCGFIPHTSGDSVYLSSHLIY